MKNKLDLKLKLKIELNKTQKLIFLMAFIIFIVIFILWLFVYSPTRAKANVLKEELDAIRLDIRDITRIAGGQKNMDVAYKKFHEKLKELNRIIPTEEKSALSLLSKIADEMGIKILIMRPGGAAESQIDLEIKGKLIVEMPMSLELKCDYKTLGEYLNRIRTELPVLVVVNEVKMSRLAEGGNTYLKANLNLRLFMLKG